MSPRSTPPPTTATAKPTRARPRRSRSVMLNLPSIEAGERPDRRLEQLLDLLIANFAPVLVPLAASDPPAPTSGQGEPIRIASGGARLLSGLAARRRLAAWSQTPGASWATSGAERGPNAPRRRRRRRISRPVRHSVAAHQPKREAGAQFLQHWSCAALDGSSDRVWITCFCGACWCASWRSATWSLSARVSSPRRSPRAATDRQGSRADRSPRARYPYAAESSPPGLRRVSAGTARSGLLRARLPSCGPPRVHRLSDYRARADLTRSAQRG